MKKLILRSIMQFIFFFRLAEPNSTNPAIWLVHRVGAIFSSRPPRQPESVELSIFVNELAVIVRIFLALLYTSIQD